MAVIRGEVGEVHAGERGGAADEQRGEIRAQPAVRCECAEQVRVRGARRAPPRRGLHELRPRRPEAVAEGGQRLPRRRRQPDPERRRGAVPVRLGLRVRDGTCCRAGRLLWVARVHRVINPMRRGPSLASCRQANKCRNQDHCWIPDPDHYYISGDKSFKIK